MALNNASVRSGGEESGTRGASSSSSSASGRAETRAPRPPPWEGRSSFEAVSDQINTSVKKFRQAVKNVTNKLAPSG